MANALQYISNIGKSVTYSAIDKIKDMSPVTAEFADQNKDLGKILYESVKDFKNTARKTTDYVLKSQVGEFATEYKKAFFEDLKSGKFYNRERMDQMDTRASGDLLNFDLDDPFADFDSDNSDDGFNFNDDDTDDWGDIGDDDKYLADQIDQVGEKTANAVAYATGRAAEYMVASNKQSMTALQKHNEYLIGKMSVGLGAVNSSISNLMQFNEQAMKKHIENSKLYFETSTKLDTDRNEILKKLLENQTNLYKSTVQEQKKSNIHTYSDIVGGEGTPDL